MRETYDNLWSLLGTYKSVRESMTAMPTLTPKKDYEQISRKMAGKIIQSRMEDKLAFIADVELFVKWFYRRQKSIKPVPETCLFDIFHLRFCSSLSRFHSYGHLSLHYRNRIKKGEDLPLRLKYKEHIWDIAKNMGKDIEEYYINKGLMVHEDAVVT